MYIHVALWSCSFQAYNTLCSCVSITPLIITACCRLKMDECSSDGPPWICLSEPPSAHIVQCVYVNCSPNTCSYRHRNTPLYTCECGTSCWCSLNCCCCCWWREVLAWVSFSRALCLFLSLLDFSLSFLLLLLVPAKEERWTEGPLLSELSLPPSVDTSSEVSAGSPANSRGLTPGGTWEDYRLF